MFFKLTISKDIDLKLIDDIAQKYYHGSVADALDHYLEDKFSEENEEAIELMEDAIYKMRQERRK